MTAETPAQAPPIDPWRALRFACDGLERICMGTADEADSSSIAEKALFAAIGLMGVSDIAAQQPQPAPDPDLLLREAFELIANDPPFEPRAAKAWDQRRKEWVTAWRAWREAGPEPQPAPELDAAMRETASRELAAAMAEARRYREALQQVAARAAGNATKRMIGDTARRALEGK